MKILLLILSSFSLVLISGCGTDNLPCHTQRRTIINKTNHLVTLVPFNQDGIITDNIKIIAPHNQISKESRVCPPGGGGIAIIDVISDAFLSKIVIVFDDNKKIEYSNCPIKCDEVRNIFEYYYSIEDISNYTITQEDYEKAIDCQGDCY